MVICNGDVTVASRVFGVSVLFFFLHFQRPHSRNILMRGWFIIKVAATSAQNT